MQGGVIPTARSHLRLARARWGPPYGLRSTTLACVFSALSCAFSAPALAASAFATADTYLKSGQPNKNQGTETILRTQESGNNRVLVRFDQADIATAVGTGTLTQAKLRLNIDFNANNWGAQGRAVAVHRMLQAWTELGATWNCPDDTNTGNGSPDCTPWVMNDSSQYPFLVTPTDVVAHENNQLGPVEWDVTADVQAFLAGAANHGWLIKKTDEGESGKVEYSSREGTVVPELVLTIDGTPPPAKPKLLDTFIRQGAPNKSMGSDLFLRIKDAGNNRALVAFDQDELEQNVGAQTLVSAKLKLTIIFNADNWGPSGREVAVHRMLQGWTEVGATWNCADDLNIENASPDCAVTAWDMTNSAAWPFDPTPTATALHSNAQTGVVEWDVTTDVQAFLSGTANYGWLIKKVDEGSPGHVQYSSREGAAAPQLILELSGDEPPVITVTSPADGSFTNTTPITVTGFVNEEATVTVNGQPATVTPGPAGTFLFTRDGVALLEGPNTITVSATDQAGNTSTVAVTATLDTVVPEAANPGLITISDPVNGQVTVTGGPGAVEANATVTITNTRTGESVTVTAGPDGSFSASLGGQPGDAFTVVVKDAAGNTSGSVQIGVPAPESAVTLHASPSSGIAPLRVTFSTLSGFLPASIRLDLEGDGSVDFTGSTLDDQAFTYTVPGRYQPAVIVTDAQGNQFTASTVVLVEDQAALDALLQSQWAGMKAALQQGDIQAALAFIHEESRAAYEQAFTQLTPVLATVGTELGEIHFVEVRGNLAEYELLVVENGQSVSYYVEFIRDENEQWRLKFF